MDGRSFVSRVDGKRGVVVRAPTCAFITSIIEKKEYSKTSSHQSCVFVRPDTMSSMRSSIQDDSMAVLIV